MSDERQKSELRKNVRLNWLCSLAALSDIELQQRWIDKRITNPAWTYVEFMCGYFDDIGLSNHGYEAMIHEGFFTQEEYDCVKYFHKALDAYEEPNGAWDPAAILADPKWQAIVNLGKHSTDRLAQLLTSTDEKRALLEKWPPLTDKDFTWPD